METTYDPRAFHRGARCSDPVFVAAIDSPVPIRVPEPVYEQRPRTFRTGADAATGMAVGFDLAPCALSMGVQSSDSVHLSESRRPDRNRLDVAPERCVVDDFQISLADDSVGSVKHLSDRNNCRDPSDQGILGVCHRVALSCCTFRVDLAVESRHELDFTIIAPMAMLY